jgi:SAM-dependent methyltransferase
VGWVGAFGSEHHRRIAIPAALELLDVRPGERVLDVGCGHGVLARPLLEAGAVYTGVDASPRLIATARRTYGAAAQFAIADATRLPDSADLAAGSFDAAVFLLSIADMDPLEDAMAGCARCLAPGGRLVIVMTHPAFRIPRHSGWGFDEGRKLRYRRVDAYLSRMAIPLSPTAGRRTVSTTYHRPLEAYVTALADAGLAIDALRELPTFQAARSGPSAKAENAANREFPLFLALRARKLATPNRRPDS